MVAQAGESRGDVVAEVRERLATEPGIHAAYLFGSRSRGRPRPDSDLDVALLLAPEVDAGPVQLRVMELLEGAAGSAPIDVVVLNEAPAALGYRVLRDGVLLIDNDHRARIEHWVRTVDSYLDMEPARRVLSEGLAHRLAEGRFGRR